MTWFLVVIFMDWEEYPLYVFTDPTFESREECMASAVDPDDIPAYVGKLLMEYGRPMPIKGINCISEDIYKKLYMQDAASFDGNLLEKA